MLETRSDSRFWWACGALLGCAVGLLQPAAAAAQTRELPRVLVVRERGVSPELRQVVGEALTPAAELIDARRYDRAARRARLSPHGTQALKRVAPEFEPSLVVVLARERRALEVTYLSAGGDTLERLTLPLLHRRALEDGAPRSLVAAARRALSRLAVADSPAQPGRRAARAAAASQLAAAGEAPEPAAAFADGAPRAPEAESDALETPAADGGELIGSADPAGEVAESESPSPLTAAVAAGFGLGQRSVSVPNGRADERVESAMFPALEVSLSGEAALGGPWLVGAQVRYQTSVGLRATGVAPAGARRQTSLRIHRIELGFAPGLRWSRQPEGVSVRLFLGWAVRGLRAIGDIGIPPYSLSGPVIRPELRVPLTAGLALRVAPELLIISSGTAELWRAAAISGVGSALGGEAALELQLSPRFNLGVSYRESRAALGSWWPGGLRDVERFATAHALLRYW